MNKLTQRLCFSLCVLLSLQGCSQYHAETNNRGHGAHAGDSSAAAQHELQARAPVEAANATATDKSASTARPGMVFINCGTFSMGTDDDMPDEAPVHQVAVQSFWMDAHEVTVAEFAKFVAATNYQTDAERFGWSGVFNIRTGAWENIAGANWRHPDGPQMQAKPDEPVCQVSWRDSAAYAKWAGKRLPTEAEWEYAARGGLVGKRYAWGDELRPGGKPVANWWQGHFPERNTGEDGYIERAPVGQFPPNGHGLFDTAGNVWEWCADWFDEEFYARSPSMNPMGPAAGTERVLRGGSWMCSENYCTNYRVAARSHATPDSCLNNLGFRCVSD